MIFWASVRSCVRQDAGAFLELWALLLVLAGCAYVVRPASRAYARVLALFAFLTAVFAGAIFYGCSMTAAGEQGLGTDLPANTYTTLRCLGNDAFSTAMAWTTFVVPLIAGIALALFGAVRWKAARRVVAFIGAAVLLIVACAGAFLSVFFFSWCTSQRLI
jgi:cytochrome c oxidase subunit IV